MIMDAAHRARDFINRNLGPILVVAALVGPAWVQGAFESQRLAVLCDSYRVEQAGYERDRAIALELGIPVRFMPPSTPEGC